MFLMNMKARMLAHPHKPALLKPATLIEATDIDGKAFFKDFIRAAEKGKGWTKYMWPVPGMENRRHGRGPGCHLRVAPGCRSLRQPARLPGLYKKDTLPLIPRRMVTNPPYTLHA